jgi:hypothetical protein
MTDAIIDDFQELSCGQRAAEFNIALSWPRNVKHEAEQPMAITWRL